MFFLGLRMRLGTLGVAVGLAALAASAAAAQSGSPRMRLHFIDVGQGSATLLEFKCGAVLVDTGAAETRAGALRAYLDRFFELRPDLQRTLEAVFLTHCHKDHALGLVEVARHFTVKRYLDNGLHEGSGSSQVNALLAYIRDEGPGIQVREISDASIRALPHKLGLSSVDIDPLKCDDCDPEVRLLAGGHHEKPDDMPKTAYENANNNSLVIRASLGGSSVLITGDMETHGLKRLTTYYGQASPLDVDVLVAGHHGSANGLTQTLVDLASPKLGIISCGKWNDGLGEPGPISTWMFGHPNRGIVEMLAKGVTRTRTPKTVKVGEGRANFTDTTVRKGVYCTGWDGSIVVDAYPSGTIRVKRSGIGG